MISTKRKNDSGFIALMSAIVMSAILLLIASTLSFTGFSGRLNILDSEYKEKSSALAEACMDTAILKIANNKDYILIAPNDHNILVGSDSCNIVSLSPNTPRIFPITIKTQALVNN